MSRLKERFFIIVATSFGLGYLPIAPGTWGTLPGVAFFLAVSIWTPAWLHTWLILGALLIVSAATIALGPWAEGYWKKKDPGALVTDEVAGFLATVLLFRAPGLLHTTIWAFVVTRFFDIIKLPPARRLERLPAGWGVLLDDLSASVYAAGALYVIADCFPKAIGIP